MKKQRKSLKRLRLIIIAVVLVAVLIGSFYLYSENFRSGNENIIGIEKDSVEEQQGLQFPYQLEDGKIEVTSLFPYTMLNPDCSNEQGEDIACISFKNKSEEYLESAEFTVELLDGTKFVFRAENVLPGASVLAFSVDNVSYDMTVDCKKVQGNVKFDKEIPLMEDKISVSVEQTDVTLTNHTEEELTDLVIYCHTLFEGEYLGGLTYSYSVEKIEAGSSVVFSAIDCYLGEAAVVRIVQEK